MTGARHGADGSARRALVLGAVAGALLVGVPAPSGTLRAQERERTVRAVQGTVRLAFPAPPGSCASGAGGVWMGRSSARDEWEPDCPPALVRMALDVRAGQVQALRAYVGGRWRGPATDLGTVSEQEAGRLLLGLAKDTARPAAVRRTALTWLAQVAAESATRGLAEIADADGDREVRKQAIFALSQQRTGDPTAALIHIARTQKDPELRRTAIFWLGQSKDPKALAYFEALF